MILIEASYTRRRAIMAQTDGKKMVFAIVSPLLFSYRINYETILLKAIFI